MLVPGPGLLFVLLKSGRRRLGTGKPKGEEGDGAAAPPRGGSPRLVASGLESAPCSHEVGGPERGPFPSLSVGIGKKNLVFAGD